MEIDREKIKEIIAEVLRNMNVEERPVQANSISALKSAGTGNGLFDDVDSATESAEKAQQELESAGMELRKRIVYKIREYARHNAKELAQITRDETGLGRTEDKVKKIEISADKSPGTEDLESVAYSGDYGLTVFERVPFGLICSITPMTNPTSTIINHAIIMISAGNSIIFSPHPGAKNCTNRAVEIVNEASVSAGGMANLAVSIREPSLRTVKITMDHPKVKMVVATGGPGVVRAAFESGKKVIAAGPGNPPVIVDETADLKKAARDITDGASFDNNILCIAEKEIFVMETVADKLVEEFRNCGVYVAGRQELNQLERLLLYENHPHKDWIGKDAGVILNGIGVRGRDSVRLVVVEVDSKSHPFVQNEMLMPVVPLLRVRDFKTAVADAVDVEHGYKHTAIIHSKDLDRITQFARAIKCALFVANAPSYASLGADGEGPVSFTIAGPTGEGLTTPRHFTKEKSVTVGKSLSIK